MGAMVMTEGRDLTVAVGEASQIAVWVIAIGLLPAQRIGALLYPVHQIVDIAGLEVGSLLARILHGQQVAVGVIAERRHPAQRIGDLGHLVEVVVDILNPLSQGIQGRNQAADGIVELRLGVALSVGDAAQVGTVIAQQQPRVLHGVGHRQQPALFVIRHGGLVVKRVDDHPQVVLPVVDKLGVMAQSVGDAPQIGEATVGHRGGGGRRGARHPGDAVRVSQSVVGVEAGHVAQRINRGLEQVVRIVLVAELPLLGCVLIDDLQYPVARLGIEIYATRIPVGIMHHNPRHHRRIAFITERALAKAVDVAFAAVAARSGIQDWLLVN